MFTLKTTLYRFIVLLEFFFKEIYETIERSRRKELIFYRDVSGVQGLIDSVLRVDVNDRQGRVASKIDFVFSI